MKITVLRAIVISVILGTLLPALGAGFYLIHVDNVRKLDQDVEKMLVNEAEVLALGVRESLWALDAASTRAMVEAVLKNPAIVSIDVLDQRLGRFAHADMAERRHGTIHQIVRPIVHSSGIIGHIRLELTDALAQDAIAEQQSDVAILLSLQLVISVVLILFVLQRRVVTPLQRLGKEAAMLAAGDLNTPITPHHDDEIGDVERRLEVTRRALRELFGTLEDKNRTLEQDLQERMRVETALRHSEQKFFSMFQHAPIPICVVRSEDGVCLDVNPGFVSNFGFGRELIVNRRWPELPLIFNEEARTLLQHDSDQALIRADVRLRTAEGHLRDCQIHVRPVSMDGTPCLLVALVDVTSLSEARRQIEDLNTSLEQRVAERTRDLAATNAELGTALKHLEHTRDELVRSGKLAALGSLVAGIAHELNTPIGNGLMMASTLQDMNRQFSEQMQAGLRRSTLEAHINESAAAADILIRNLQRAAELITSFKQVAADQTSSQRRSFGLSEVVDEILLTMRPAMRNSPHLIRSMIPPGLKMDSYPGPLGQVIANLLNNALLHAFDGIDHGEIALEAEADGDTHLILRCRDNGAGIPPENLNRIFDPFFTTRMGRDGTGLGLNIVHNIVTGMLGGEISVSSEPGRGACFTLRLPRQAPEKARSGEPEPAAG